MKNNSGYLEKTHDAVSGYVVIVIDFFLFFIALLLAAADTPMAFFPALLAVLSFPGFFTVNPNGSRVLTLLGKYVGTVRKNGFFWVNPLYAKKKVSLRARNFDSERLKVNDLIGNPILISVILVWRVKNTYAAAFEVDDYENFVKVQTDAAVRKLAGTYPYDNFEDSEDVVTLRSGLAEVNHKLEKELEERLQIAGIEILEARIGYLAYAEEIASAMLRRQQASAIVSARHKIVEGAVGMVEMALEEIAKKEVVSLDEERKATMVSNLMVVLCADKDVSPVINSGSLY
ncbi:MAG: SPFH domain-containing protein [Cytophagales bacterium]|nr:SPFH domain-containing protein [Cytophagales bacterium]